MTKEEFLNMQGDTPLPIKLADGRMGLCLHWTDTEILVDAYRGNDCEQIKVPFVSVVDAGGGACAELPTVTYEEFCKALDDAEEKIVGEGMNGMGEAKWLCTACGATGVGISAYTFHWHEEHDRPGQSG